MSRIVGGERLLGDGEKEVLRRMLWQVAEFCGVQILTYAVMSNHFHVLVWVPTCEQLSDQELVRRYRALYGNCRGFWQPTPEGLSAMLEDGGKLANLWRERLLKRMGDVSAFMKTLKQRFSVSYNKAHGRFGTLWADRFKSVLVEGDPQVLATVAAYIDLNPVRAGLVEDPSAYRWCGYAEAMAGKAAARKGLAEVFEGRSGTWSSVGPAYRRLLFGKGLFGSTKRAAIKRERVVSVIAQGGTVSLTEALRCRVRYFTDGAILGSTEFVSQWLARRPEPRNRVRPLRAHSMSGANWGKLAVARGLREAVFR